MTTIANLILVAFCCFIPTFLVKTRSTMRTFFTFSLLLALLGTVSAQFNFFEQMFGGNGGGGQQHQQQQNVPSDSSYYRSQVDRGKSSFFPTF